MARDLTVRYEGDTAGADAAAERTRGQLQQTASAAEAMSKTYTSSMRKAEASGRTVGDSLVKSVAKAAGSTLLKSAGSAAGTALANAAGRQIAQTNLFKSLQAKAGIAGQQAGAKVARGVEKQAGNVNWSKLRTPALVAAALGAGVLFGRRFGNSAERSAASAFRPNFSAPKAAFRGLFTGLTATALGAGAAAGAVLAGAIAKGGARLDAIDSARGKLLGLGNDAKAVDQIMQDALSSVKGTAFGLDEAATVSATAVAAGIKPGKELQRTLKLVADTATIGNTSLSESGSIFNKVATSNKVYNDTLNQLGDRGIPIVQLLAKQMGKSADEVTKLSSKGKIDFKTFQAALEAGLGGAALKSGDTFQGALKNAKAALGRFGANLLKGVFPQLKGVFGDVTKGLDGLGPTAERIGKRAGAVFADLVRLAKSLSPVIKSIGTVASGAFSAFAGSLGGGQSAVKSLTDFVTTHQADMVGFFVKAGSAAIGFGKVVAVVVSGALRAYAGLQKGIQASLEFILSKTQAAVSLAGSAANALGLDKQAGDLAKVAGAIQTLRDNNKANDAGAGLAESIADGIDNKLLPALGRADEGLNKLGQQEITKAAQRDAANKTAQAIRNIGTSSTGSQIKLKRWSDVSKLGADAQSQLRGRIRSAASALRGQIDAQQAAGAGQKALTRTWQQGRDKLAAEFRQMGLSRREAGRLADKYAGIKPKVKTTFSTPGLSQAKSDANGLANSLNRIPRNIQVKITQETIKKGDRLAAAVDRNVSATGGVWMSGPKPRVIKAATGRVLPGFTPGRDVHRFYSATAGELDLSGGEAIMRPEFTRAVGGPSGVARINREAESGDLARRLAGGGVAALEPFPIGPSLSGGRPERAGGTAVLDPRAVDALAGALRDAVEGLAIQLSTDSRGIMALVDARIVEQGRRKRTP